MILALVIDGATVLLNDSYNVSHVAKIWKHQTLTFAHQVRLAMRSGMTTHVRSSLPVCGVISPIT